MAPPGRTQAGNNWCGLSIRHRSRHVSRVLQAWLTSNDEMHVELGDDVLLVMFVVEDLPPS